MSKFDEKALIQRCDAARQGVLKKRLSDLTVSQLDAMIEHLDEDRAKIVEVMEQVHGESQEAIENADWPRFKELKGRTADIGARFDELTEMKKEIGTARQERILNDRMLEKLGSKSRVAAWDGFIMVLIVAVVTMLLIHEFADISAETAVIFDLIDIGACLIFLGDFFFKLWLADSKAWFWKRHWVDFITSIPLPSAQTLRVGRAVRLVRLTRLMRLARLARILRVILFFWRGMDKLAATFDVKMMKRSMRILVVVLLVGAFGIWWAEGGQSNEGVETLGQSLWWSFTTVVTGGFGDIRNPTTVMGRLLTVMLIVAGMVVVGIFTATLTSLLVKESDTSGAILELELKITDQLKKIQKLLED